VEVIQSFPRPQDKKQLQSFLGLVNFYRRQHRFCCRLRTPCEERRPGHGHRR
jgi:hypothetical protein